MIKKDNIDDFSEKIAKFIQENNLFDLDLSESLRKSSGVWFKLCLTLLGSYSYNKTLHLKSIWERNQWSLRSKVF